MDATERTRRWQAILRATHGIIPQEVSIQPACVVTLETCADLRRAARSLDIPDRRITARDRRIQLHGTGYTEWTAEHPTVLLQHLCWPWSPCHADPEAVETDDQLTLMEVCNG